MRGAEQVYGKYKKTDQAYLLHLHGSSWHGNDAKWVLRKYMSETVCF